MMTGLRGNTTLFGNDWTWDIGYDYGHMSDVSTLFGLVNVDSLNAGLGPSMIDPATNQPICVMTPNDPTTAISGCTPWDPFDLYSSSAKAALQADAVPALLNSYQIERIKHADVSGGLFNLPAGTAQLAAGVSYRNEYTNTVVDSVLLINPATGTCSLSSGCTSPLQGGYNVKEAYAELFIPVLSDMPLAYGLNVTLGDRWSKYSTFGSTNNWKVAIEYRPIEDLLLRGTVSSVFRAPTISDVFGSPVASFPSISQDPCDHITVTNPACVGVPLDGSFMDFLDHQQLKGIASGSAYAGFPIQPETGKSFDFGAVYSPRFIPGFSLSADIWRIYLKNVITEIRAQTLLDLCFNGVQAYCPLIQRFGADTSEPGQIENVVQPMGNLGRIDTKGVDLSAQYKLPPVSFGQFTIGLNATYMSKFDIQTAPGLAGNQVLHGVGLMGTAGSPLAGACPSPGGDICFFPRIRAQASLNWRMGPWTAKWRMRYMSKFNVGSHDLSQGFSAVPGFKTDNPYVLHYGSTTYSDFTVGYTIEPINTQIEVGVDNVFDKQPPMLYANNTVNADTDVSDFDTLGRYYWGRVTVNF
jgi:outer membrane receptor protein involved in Fe transport